MVLGSSSRRLLGVAVLVTVAGREVDGLLPSAAVLGKPSGMRVGVLAGSEDGVKERGGAGIASAKILVLAGLPKRDLVGLLAFFGEREMLLGFAGETSSPRSLARNLSWASVRGMVVG